VYDMQDYREERAARRAVHLSSWPPAPSPNDAAEGAGTATSGGRPSIDHQPLPRLRSVLRSTSRAGGW